MVTCRADAQAILGHASARALVNRLSTASWSRQTVSALTLAMSRLRTGGADARVKSQDVV